MKATNSLPSAPFVLRLVGVILIVSSLVDYVSLLIPPNFSDKAWFANVVTQMVDRGIIPMVGLAFLFAGNFLQNGSLATSEHGKPIATFRFWALVLSMIFGALFLIAFPVHLNNTRQVSDQTLKQIGQEAADAQSQLDVQVKQRLAQITSALKDPQQAKQLDEQLKAINDAISSGQVTGDQLAKAEQAKKELEALKADPNSIEARARDFRNQRLNEISDRKRQLEQRARGDFWKTGVRVGISSLLLSLGYFMIGWTGLREMGVLNGKRRPAMR